MRKKVKFTVSCEISYYILRLKPCSSELIKLINKLLVKLCDFVTELQAGLQYYIDKKNINA